MHQSIVEPGKAKPRLLVAIDLDNYQAATNLVTQLDPQVCRVKIGKELFTACGPRIVEEIQRRGFDVFLDLKFHDIPNTTAQAVKVAANLGVWMLNIHASGGLAMMEAARNALEAYRSRPLLIAVTVLTSLDQKALAEVGINRTAIEQVTLLAQLAKTAGLDGVVSSAREANEIKRVCGEQFITVTPGIRPASQAGKEAALAGRDDQKRTMTPLEAIQNGSDYIVVGRPISEAKNPHQACVDICNEMKEPL